jgi:hypothetical protein
MNLTGSNLVIVGCGQPPGVTRDTGHRWIFAA